MARGGAAHPRVGEPQWGRGHLAANLFAGCLAAGLPLAGTILVASSPNMHPRPTCAPCSARSKRRAGGAATTGCARRSLPG